MTRQIPRRFTAISIIAALVLAACGSRGDDGGDAAPTPTDAPTTTAAAPTTEPDAGADTTEPVEPDPAEPEPEITDPEPEPEPDAMMFGTMESPCGPAGDEGVPTVADGQNGGNPLRIGTHTDHGYEAAPGLNIEMLDAARAFAQWCNEQGGIRGLPIEIVDLDGRLFSVPPAMEQACDEVFAMVGGGWVFDDQMFPRFHECGMISFSGYTVTVAAAEANGKVQPIPNPGYVKPTGWFEWAKQAHPEAITRSAILYGDFLTTQIVAEVTEATMDAVGGFEVVARTPYNPGGEANWVPFAQRLKDDEIGALFYVGSPANLVLLYRAMREVDYVPELVLGEANFYDALMVAEGNAQASEGFRARTAYAPFEEADQFPGMRSYLDMLEAYDPNAAVAGLGLQATSAFLMFVTAANACLDANDNVLERECVLAAGKAISSWTGGGLHTETNPGANVPPECGLIMGIEGGRWTRIYPELGSADDNGGGWHCDSPGAVEIAGDFGDVTAGVDPDRPN